MEMPTDISQEPMEMYGENAIRPARDQQFMQACAVEMKSIGKMPNASSTTSVEHQLFIETRNTPSVRTQELFPLVPRNLIIVNVSCDHMCIDTETITVTEKRKEKYT